MWSTSGSRHSPALTCLAPTELAFQHSCSHPVCLYPKSLFGLMSVSQMTHGVNLSSLEAVKCKYNLCKAGAANGQWLSDVGGMGAASQGKRRTLSVCSLQGKGPTSIGLQDYIGAGDDQSLQTALPFVNLSKGELPDLSVKLAPAEDVAAHELSSTGEQKGDSVGSSVDMVRVNGQGESNRNGEEEISALPGKVLENKGCQGISSELNNHDSRLHADLNAVQDAGNMEGANMAEFKVTGPTVQKSHSGKYGRELEVASRAVQLACMLTQRIQDRLLRHEEEASAKSDHSLVTIADWGVQAVISWVLTQAFPDERLSIVAEEDTEDLRGMDGIHLLRRVVAAVNECLSEASVVGITPPEAPLATVDVLKAISRGSSQGGPQGRHWVLDPVDGTLGFVRGDQYAVALAMIQDGEVVLALLGCPNFPMRREWLKYGHKYYRLASKLSPPKPSLWHKGCLMTATKGGGGAWMEPLVWNSEGTNQFENASPLPIHVSNITDPAEAAFCEPVEKGNSSHHFSAGVASSIGLRSRPLRIYSMAKYAAIARGDAEIFMKFAKVGYKEKIWDHAAGVLIVEEAGGVVTDARGCPLDFSRGRYLEGLDRGVIACAGTVLHSKIMAAVDDSWSSSTL